MAQPDVDLVNLARGADLAALIPDAALVVTTAGPDSGCDLGDGGPGDLRRAGATVVRGAGPRDVVVRFEVPPDPDALAGFVEGAVLAAWRPPRVTVAVTGRRPSNGAGPAHVRLVVQGQSSARMRVLQQGLERGLAVARVAVRSRDLAATVSSTKTPQWLAERAAAVAAETGLDVQVWDERRLAADGFGGLLAVGGGSASGPRLVRLSYRPRARPRSCRCASAASPRSA